MDYCKIVNVMSGNKFKNFTNVFVLITCLVLSNSSQAANLVTTHGVAAITSNLDKNIFRTRAIENALQNLISQGSQTVDSFSIVENGQVLIDQVHLASKLGVQEYSVVKEEIKGKFYHVSLNVVVNDGYNKKKNNICRKAAPPAMDLSLDLEIEKYKLPAWVLFSGDFINQAITNHEFEPNLLKSNSQNKIQDQATLLYSLHKNDNAKKSSDNLYKLHASVIVEAIYNNKFLDKNLDLKVTMSSFISREGEKILERNIIDYFPIIQKNLNGLLSPVTRKDWPSTKKNMKNFVLEKLDQQLADLNCLNFYPKIYVKSGEAYINYGRLDGIMSSDMFLVKNGNAKKIYFQLESLNEYQAKIKLISKIESLEDLIGSEVEVVSGS